MRQDYRNKLYHITQRIKQEYEYIIQYFTQF